jgi:hypothetical protein
MTLPRGFLFAPVLTESSPFRRDFAWEFELGRSVPLFPLLVPAGSQRQPEHLRRALVTGTQLAGIPDVAITYLVPTPGGGPPTRAWARTERVEECAATTREFEEIAYYNVTQRPGSWQVLEPAPGTRLAVCQDDYLAAERILDPAFMIEAARHLGADGQMLLVGIPERGTLLATPFTSTSADMAFIGIIEQTFRNAKNAPITPWTYFMTNGQLGGVMELAG